MYREDDKLYLIMERKPGTQLSELWPAMTKDEMRDVSAQLRKIWDHLRSIPSPGIYSGITGGPLQHRWFRWLEPDPRINGPFNTEEDLNKALMLRSEKNWESTGTWGWMAEFFARNLPGALTGHHSVLTHGDLQRKDIVVVVVPANNLDKRRVEVSAVVDWENAGWYPNYWEYASCFVDLEWRDTWPEHVEHIVDPHIPEAAVLRMIRQDLDF
ncbi:Uu.00g098200.m01.CDS01 [Anthostomella pinea]|uniref:Uu.00g098200.m01.CDS01 n=1 Tax=Anthostomella pinea TaxID=933095 RepID=A0AAI8YF08_9PEZI|nr:Uu.00g098200.m01.CDS01 [Anthostomella pinea]